MFRLHRLVSAALLVAATTLVAPPPLGHAQGATIFRVDPAQISVGLGQVETVRVVIENVKELYGGEAHLKFDPAVLEVVDADPARDGIQITPGDFLKPDFVAVNKADNTLGTIDYALTQLNPTPSANGSGVFMIVQFRGKAQGKTSKITASGNILAVIAGPQKVVAGPFTWVDGSVAVVEPRTPTPTPTAVPTLTPTRTSTSSPTATAPPPTATAGVAKPAATSVAAPTPAPGGAPAAAAAPGGAGGLSDDLLIGLAAAGFLGAAVLLLLATLLVLRKPKAGGGS
jgi:hypothetical protein